MMLKTKLLAMVTVLVLGGVALGLAGAGPAGASGPTSPVVRSHSWVADPPGNAYSSGTVRFHANGWATVDPALLRDGGRTSRWAFLQLSACTAGGCPAWRTIASTGSASWVDPGPTIVTGSIRSVWLRLCNDEGVCSAARSYAR